MNPALHTSLVQRSLASVWHPCTQMQHHETTPLIGLRSGKGAWLFDTEGRRYLDAISSWWVNVLGHAHPRINAAIKEQLDTLEHAMLAGFTHEPVVALSEKLAALTQGALGHCFYASDGASAVEIALKMSFHAWRQCGRSKKQEFVCFRGGYHGETLGALSVTDVEIFREAYAPLLRPSHFIASPDARCAQPGQTPQAHAQSCIDELETLLQERAEHICAVVIEPLVQCAGGMAMHEPAFLQSLSQVCMRHGVHLIADEIAVGCGRTGTFFACEQAGIWPDFLCLSKGISAGYLPLSLVMTRESIYQAFYDADVTRGFLHSHSYTGNPLACRAAQTMLDIFEGEQVLQRNRVLAQHITRALAPVAAHPQVRHFRQRGMIWAFDVQMDERDAAQSAQAFSRRFSAAALQHELLLRPIGQTVYLMPPYILDEEEVALLGERIFQTLTEVLVT